MTTDIMPTVDEIKAAIAAAVADHHVRRTFGSAR